MTSAESPTPELATHLPAIRRRFPALDRRQDGQPVVYFDGPAGTQVPESVIQAITHYLRTCNANHGGQFATSQESDALLEQVHRGAADLLGADDPNCVYFGPNMTTLTFALSRAVARTWRAGDEIILTRSDHDANVTPWTLAAEERGVRVHFVPLRPDDCTLDQDAYRQLLSPRTRLVAVGCASNATGTVHPVREMARAAHEVGALVFLDAVHYAPHRLIDVQQLDADFLACSAYKFFGPHVGLMWGRRELLETLAPYKLRPAPDQLPDRWMTGTQNHACLAGTLAAIDYLAELGRVVSRQADLARRPSLQAGMAAIEQYEQQLGARLIDALTEMPAVRIWGITDADRRQERLPTVALTHERHTSLQLARYFAQHGIFTWHGNYYALQLSEALGQEPDGMLRIGLVHYNTAQEVDRLLALLKDVP